MSPLQMQYPLSPKKFWKKYLSNFITFSIIWLVISAFIIVILNSSLALSISDAAKKLLVLILLVESVLIFGGLFLYAWYIKTYIRKYYYDASDNFITIKKGVFAPSEIHVMYQKIQDVYVDQDILDRIMGLYDVHLASATVTSSIEAHIDGVEFEQAEGLKHLILSRIQTGGVVTSNNNPFIPQSINAPGPTTIKLSEEVSSKNYPIEGNWVTQSIIGNLILSSVISLFGVIYLSVPGKHSDVSLIDSLGLSHLLVWIVLFVGLFFYQLIYMIMWKNIYYFEFLPEFIVMRTGVLSRREEHLPYHSIQDVNVKQSLIERMFGLATVSIENAAATQMVGKRVVKSGIVIPGQTLARANHIAEAVRNITVQKNTATTGL